VREDGRFADRADAGRQLGTRLAERPRPGALVLGLPRGGVPVAAQVARALGAPLDLLVVAKLRVPGRPELAMGAVAAVPGGERVEEVRVEEVLVAAGIPGAVLARARDEAAAGLRRRAADLRGDRPGPVLTGRSVVLVDDGLATGATVRAAAAAARAQHPRTVTVAVPVGAPGALAAVEGEVDELVCLLRPARFRFVEQFYDDFAETSDADVRSALAAADG
jgi:putative phosphoribosyl transferase